ncbi:MAG: hypothetical protein HY510_07180 [Acidobacteria bacterium]|nr:hypothetical protein [Acidobacteriota bacterium]
MRSDSEQGGRDAPLAGQAVLARWVGWTRRFPPYFMGFVVSGLLLAIGWRAFYAWKSPTFILTPFQEMPPLAPVYGFFLPRSTYLAFLPLLILAAGVLIWRGLSERKEILFLCLAVVFSAGLRFSVHAARTASLPGREFLTYPGEDVIYDVARIASPADFLRDYTRLQPRLSLHGRTKPPGFALMHFVINRWIGDHVLAIGSLLTLVASLIVIPAYCLGSLLRGRGEDGRACAMLAATAPGGVSFGAVSLDAVFAVVAATILTVAVLELRKPHWASRLALGLFLFAGMMLTYSTLFVGLFCACLLVFDRLRRPAACLGHLLQVLAFFLLPFFGLYLFAGFDAWECFVSARRLNAALMSRIVGHSLGGFQVWLYSSLGNLLAFLIYLGPAIVGSWWLSPFSGSGRLEKIFGGAFLLTLFAACFGGIYLMETERVLLFLVPAALLPSCSSPFFRPRWAVVLAGLQAIVLELLVFTLW